MFDDMEDDNAANFYGGFWYTYLGGTPATVWPASGDTLTPSAGGANSTAYAMRITGTVGIAGTTYPCIGMGSQLNATAGAPNFTETDISSCTGIKFWVKGDGNSYLMKIPYTDPAGNNLTGYNDYKVTFNAPAVWSQVDAPFATFAQAAGWGTSAVISTVLQHAKEFQWQTNFNAAAGLATVDFWVDEITLYGCASCPATPTPYPTATNTPNVTSTFTNTYTNTPVGTNTFTFTATNTNTYTPTVPTNTFTPSPTLPPAGSCVFDDMEDDNAANNYGGFWYSYLGGTPATVWPGGGETLTPSAGGANGTNYAMRITGTVGIAGTTYPCIGMGSQLSATGGAPNFTETDISSCTGIKFWVKGDGNSYLMKIPYTDSSGNNLTGYNDYKVTFTAPAAWSQVTAPFATFAQAAGWGTSAVMSTVLQHAKEFQWQTNFNAAAGLATVDFWVDEVVLYGCASCPAAPTPYPTATNTVGGSTNTFTPTVPGPTNTFTFTNTPSPTPSPTNTAGIPTATNTPSGGGCSFDDMEDDNAANNYGGFWYSYLGGTPATVWPGVGETLTPSAGGANGTNYAMRITGTVGIAGTTYPCIGMGSQLSATGGAPNFTETDISSCTGIKFWVKGDGNNYLMKIPYTDGSGNNLTGYNDYKVTFNAPAAWSQVDAPFATFAQAAGWGTSAVMTTVLQHAKEFQWQTNFNAAAGTATADLWVDEVVLYGCASCPAAPTAYPTATNTAGGATNTFTPTPTNTAPAATSTNTFTNTPTQTNTPTTVPTVANPSLIITGMNVPVNVTVGQQLTVVMNVNNNGNALVNNIAPSALTVSVPADVSLSTGPSPATVGSLAANGNTEFTWVYTVLQTGTVSFQGTAAGNSGGPVTSAVSNSLSVALLAAPTPTITMTPVGTATPTPANVIEFFTPVDTRTPVILIRPNPNPTPGTTPGRFVDFTVTKPITKTVFKIYTSMGRLIRRVEQTLPPEYGKISIPVDGTIFHGLANGVYYYVVIVTDTSGVEAKSPISKIVVQ